MNRTASGRAGFTPALLLFLAGRSLTPGGAIVLLHQHDPRYTQNVGGLWC